MLILLRLFDCLIFNLEFVTLQKDLVDKRSHVFNLRLSDGCNDLLLGLGLLDRHLFRFLRWQAFEFSLARSQGFMNVLFDLSAFYDASCHSFNQDFHLSFSPFDNLIIGMEVLRSVFEMVDKDRSSSLFHKSVHRVGSTMEGHTCESHHTRIEAFVSHLETIFEPKGCVSLE